MRTTSRVAAAPSDRRGTPASSTTPGCPSRAPVLSAIRFHHDPQDCPPADADIVHCVALANLICSVKDLTSVGQNLVRLPRESLAARNLDKSDLKILASDLDQELQRHQHLFDIQAGK